MSEFETMVIPASQAGVPFWDFCLDCGLRSRIVELKLDCPRGWCLDCLVKRKRNLGLL